VLDDSASIDTTKELIVFAQRYDNDVSDVYTFRLSAGGKDHGT
jgi:hypothetical protein